MTAGHVQNVPDEVPLTREDVRDAIKTPEDGWRVVAALMRMEHGPDCPDHEVWELLAAVLERAGRSPRMIREHGTRARYVRGPDEDNQPGPCRCTPCRGANRAEQNKAYRLKAYGRWQPYTDAAPVRAHVECLMGQGLRLKRIAQLAGVAQPTVHRLLHGDPKRGVPPSSQVRTRTAEAILAVRLVLDDLPDTALIDPTGTRRRIQALVALGWSQSKLAARSGLHPTSFALLIHASSVRVDTARKIRALYDALWTQAPPQLSARDRVSVGKSKAWAARQGWVSPLAWDDGDLDDPAARPHGVRKDVAA